MAAMFQNVSVMRVPPLSGIGCKNVMIIHSIRLIVLGVLLSGVSIMLIGKKLIHPVLLLPIIIPHNYWIGNVFAQMLFWNVLKWSVPS